MLEVRARGDFILVGGEAIAPGCGGLLDENDVGGFLGDLDVPDNHARKCDLGSVELDTQFLFNLRDERYW